MEPQATQNPEVGPLSERELLMELVQLQKQHNQDLAEFKKLIGWIYAFLITAIIVGILVVFSILSGGRL